MKRAITLIEVVVVIGIVAIVLSIALPALSRAGSASRTLECQSNLRQLFAMAEHYSNDNDGRYPVAVRYERSGADFVIIAWDWKQVGSHGPISPGPLWRGVTDPHHVQQCPECLDRSTFGRDPFTGYNYNTTFIGGEATFPQTGWSNVRRGLPRTVWRKVETTAVFGDGGWNGGANKFMRAPENTIERDLPTVYGGGQAFRHSGRTNVCYLDGHLAAHATPHPGVHANDPLLRDIMGFPENGFLSNDDSAYDPR
jgi:prepilin-type processing-associated H-X9-DG protein